MNDGRINRAFVLRGPAPRFVSTWMHCCAIAGVALLALGLGACGAQEAPGAEAGPAEPRAPEPTSVRATLVEQGTLDLTEDFTGEILADRVVELAPLGSGQLLELFVDQGDVVSAGMVIGRLDADEQETMRAEQRARIQTEGARRDVARAELRDHLREIERRRVLVERGAFNPAELQRLEDRSEVLQSAVELAESQHREAQRALSSVETSLRRRDVVSPVDGVVVDRLVTAGAMVSPQEPLIRVIDESTLELVARVSERRLGDLRLGTRARVRLDARPDETLEATVIRVGSTVEREARTVEVRLRVDPRSVTLRHGMFARGEMIVQSVPSALHIPVEALVGQPGSRAVFVIREGTAHRVPVEVELETRRRAAIVGVAPGDLVVLSPPRGLGDGDAVTIADGPTAGQGEDA